MRGPFSFGVLLTCGVLSGCGGGAHAEVPSRGARDGRGHASSAAPGGHWARGRALASTARARLEARLAKGARRVGDVSRHDEARRRARQVGPASPTPSARRARRA